MGKGRPKGRPFACAPRVGEGKGNVEASTGIEPVYTDLQSAA